MAKVARKPKKKKSGLLITLIIIVVILLIAVAGLGWYSANLKPSSDFKQEKLIEVKEEFSVFGVSLLDMPWQGSVTKINWLWLIAILSGVTSMLTSLISMRYSRAMMGDQQQPGQGCTNNMMIITLFQKEF